MDITGLTLQDGKPVTQGMRDLLDDMVAQMNACSKDLPTLLPVH